MEFRNEIASTGELSDIGLLLRRNVDRSYRRGIELECVVAGHAAAVVCAATRTLSRNRIHTWTQFFDVYDAAGNVTGSEPLTLITTSSPLLTPSLHRQSVDRVRAVRRARRSASPAATSDARISTTRTTTHFVAPSFFTLDANVPLRARAAACASRVQVNNLLEQQARLPERLQLSLPHAAAHIEGIAYYYPQATRNAVVMVDFRR